MGEKARPQEVIKAISEHKIIAIVRGVEKEQLIPLVEALYVGASVLWRTLTTLAASRVMKKRRRILPFLLLI